MNENHLRVLNILSDSEYHSGQDLAYELSMTRTAIWKIVESLRTYGLSIDARKRKGYRLHSIVELMDRNSLELLLDDRIKKLIKGIEIHHELESTNQCLLERNNRNDIHACVVLTEFQTSGRGRRGNVWCCPLAGGIMLSIGWCYDYPVTSLMHLSLAIGNAVMRSLNRSGIRGVGLKWPNDLVYNGGKLGGILLETRSESAGPSTIVAGIGLNYAISAGSNLMKINQPWTDINNIVNPPPSRNRLISILISEVIGTFSDFQNIASEKHISEWKAYDCIRGRKVRLHLPEKEIEGIVEDIDNDGALVISSNGMTKRYTSGEVSIKVT